MNKDLYDPTGKQPAKVRTFLSRMVNAAAQESREADTLAVVAKQKMYDALEGAHATGHAQRKMGLLTVPQMVELTGLSKQRVEAILKDRRDLRITEAKQAASNRKVAGDAATG